MARQNKSSKIGNPPLSDPVSKEVRPGNTPAVMNPGYHLPLIGIVFAILFALIAITSFLQKSPTVDEPIHLLSGYAILKWGDYRANPEHPPLAKMWAALPILFHRIEDSRSKSPTWDLIPTDSPGALHTVDAAAQWLFVNNDAETLFFSAKVMMITLAIFLGWFVFMWSREIFGLGAGVVSLIIYGLDPNILTHSQLIHTDLPFTAFFFIATYYFYRVIDKLTIGSLVSVCLFFGLAVITKHAYSAAVLIWLILALVKVFYSDAQVVVIGQTFEIRERWKRILVAGGVIGCVLITAYVMVWTAYGFRFDAIPGGQLRLPMVQELPESAALRRWIDFLLDYRLFPEAWIYGQLHVFNNLARNTYLFGHMTIDKGQWLYFPVAFAVKTPVPTILLLVGTAMLWRTDREYRRLGFILLLPAGIYFSLGIWSGINIGLRHILPIYPFLFVAIGGTAIWFWKTKLPLYRWGLGLLGAWYLISSAVTYPNYITFFNEIAGGPKNGHRILLDSNLDWGQDLKGLKAWMVKNSVSKLQFLYFGFYNISAPRYYGIDAVYLPGSWVGADEIVRESLAQPDYIAISVNHLYGQFPGGPDEGLVKPFRRVRPVAIIHHTIYVFSLETAIETYQEIVRSPSVSAEAHYYLANLLNHSGKKIDAIKHYRESVRMDTRFADAHNRLGKELLKASELDEAERHFLRVLELPPLKNRHETQFQLGAILAKQGRLTEATHYFKEATITQPTFAPAHFNLGILAAAQGNLSQAVSAFRLTLRFDPKNADAHAALARALAEQNETAEASRHFQEAIKILKTQNQPRVTGAGGP